MHIYSIVISLKVQIYIYLHIKKLLVEIDKESLHTKTEGIIQITLSSNIIPLSASLDRIKSTDFYLYYHT
jgi:hypothetical protein